MKTIKTYFIMALAGCMALTGCEMKNELMGDKTEDLPHGTLELGVTLKKSGITTKAEETSISTDNFPVSIVGTSTGITEVKKDFKTLTEVPKPLRLPVGTYKVSSHSPMELKQQMDVPYYAGEQTMTIQANITSETTVKCTMQNSRITLTYSDDFKKSFKSWNITLDDGLNHVLTFTHDNLTPKDVFWLFEKDKVEAITANITAVTTNGNTITATRKMIKAEAGKPQGIDEIYFVGGDAIQIPMGVEESPEGSITGITIKPSINFDNDNKDEFVELPTVDDTPEPPVVDPEEPTPPTGDGPTLTLTDSNGENLLEKGYSYSFSGNNFDGTHKVLISTPKGLKSLKVTIIAGNEGFQGIVDEMNFTDRELVGDTELSNLLSGLGINIDMPEANKPSYNFPIGQFYTMLNIYGPTVDADQTDYPADGVDYHTFKIVATDNNADSATVEYKVTIRK